ncbi:hypothetical protein ES703_81305 [subsurface metagenome]
MASIKELLEAVNTKEAAVSTADLASELKASKEGTLKQLTREKDKGHVEGNSQEGWLITDAGRKVLEKGHIHPSMIDEEVTPRQQFEAIGRRIGIKEDRILLATDIVWSGDYNDVKWVWDALRQADIADDLRSVWVNSWRAKLHKGIPPELETELTGASKAVATEGEKGATPSKNGGREYIIDGDEPVFVGANLGDYSLQDAKDILSIRVLRNRFSGASQAGTDGGAAPGTGEKVSDILTALSPYLNKESKSDVETLKEIISDKLALQRQEILSQIPQSGQPAQPKSFMAQVTELVAALGSLKEAGPLLRSILGIPESPGNPSAGVPAQVTGPDGKPIVMDLGQVIDWRRFLNDERRSDERHDALMGVAKTVRENFGDGVSALRAAAEEVKGKGGAETSAPKSQMFRCGDCQTEFSPPAGWAGQPVKCPNPDCGREYTKEELLA